MREDTGAWWESDRGASTAPVPKPRPLPPAPQNALHDFRCVECGKPACFGEGVRLLQGIEGEWFCAKHAPADFRKRRP